MRFHARACASFHSPGQPGVMRASGDGQVISATTMPAPPMRARAQVHEVELVRHAVDRSNTAPSARRSTRFFSVTERAVYGVNIGGATRRSGASAARACACEPALEALEPGLVAQAQVLVADALAARQHRVHELLGLELIGSSARRTTSNHSIAFQAAFCSAQHVDARARPGSRASTSGIVLAA